MQAYKFQTRAIFQKPTLAPDGGGGGEVSWGNDVSRLVHLAPERGQERLEAGRLEASLGAVLTVRRSAEVDAIDEEWRVVIGGVPYQIRSIRDVPPGRPFYKEMTVEKGVAV